MSKKLYIGNLPYSITETALREMFTPVGVVDSVSIITDRDTGRPKGFAFVEMTDDDAAKQAISQINGKTLDDRAITVAEARPQVQRSGGGGGRRGWNQR
jgi:cold-inducible RNA-binding protein